MESVVINTTSKNINITKPNAYKNLDDFLYKHKYDKNNHPLITNTRIPDIENGINGGCFYISEQEYPEFLKIYYQHIIKKNKREYLTEKQLEKNAPIMIDLDLRFDTSVKTRQYTNDHIDDLIDLYLGTLKNELFQFDEDTNFPIYVFEKPSVNCLNDKTKDGIHIIIGIQTDRTTQILLRKKMIPKLKETWEGLPITNSWEDVFDEGISAGHINWQMYGSSKPNHECYRVTRIYNITFDTTDQEFVIQQNPNVKSYDFESNIYKLSARYSSHYSPFMRSEFSEEHNKQGGSNHAVKKRNANVVASSSSPLSVLNITNKEQMDSALSAFLESAELTHDYESKEIYDYTMTLPPSYYEQGSYLKWVRVGWCLKNIGKENPNKYFIIWLVFSSQQQKFDYSCVSELFSKWEKMNSNDIKGLTKRSLMYWAKMDAYEKYKQVHENTIDFYVEQTIDSYMSSFASDEKKPTGCGEADLVEVLYQLKKDQFVCVSISGNIWYQYINHHWTLIDSGTTLRSSITTELRKIYYKKAEALNEQIGNLPEGDNRKDSLDKRVTKVLAIVGRLGKTTDKKNMMIEAKDRFYDKDFLNNLDKNPWLMCFKNGVWDFQNGLFRDGKPEDYISMTTGIDYIKNHPVHDAESIKEIKQFMKQLFPIPDLEKYMWEHLASALIGTSSNQTFNNYIGEGSNGKSVLTSLMGMVLGSYKGDLPHTAITQQRTKVGGLAPEIVALKGKRYVVMQEPSKGDSINEGIMKQFTSGVEPIIARAPYMVESLEFVPQFKLVVCANQFLKINSNDHGTWRRIRVPRFLSWFTTNPVNDDPEKPYQFQLIPDMERKFEDKLKYVFMSELVDIALEKKGAVTDCEYVLSASEEYRQSQDVISEFINENVMKQEGGVIKKTRLNNAFKDWFQNTYGKNCPQMKELHVYMTKKFGKAERTGWKDVIIRDDNDFIEDENIPNIDEPEL